MKNIKYLVLLLISIFLINTSPVSAQFNPKVTFEPIEKKSTKAENKSADKISYYTKRYKALYLSDKIVDNYGNGFEKLYGLRNMRPVLHGVVYRGGSNNYYHRTNKRKNHNPLPNDGLKALANEGFSAAVYLYNKNFKTAPSSVVSDNGQDTLKYYKNTLPNRKAVGKIVAMVHNVIVDNSVGPVYLHCWNGWHQSGFISAVLLMQFCDYSPAKALHYWETCTDNNHKRYDHIKKRILKFKKFKSFEISKEMKKKLCPKPVKKK